jgi:hypothetical protein
MGCVDQTSVFRAQVKELARIYPPSTRSRREKGRPQPITHDSDATNDDGFLTEAYAIVSNAFLLGGNGMLSIMLA